jgi:predicted amidohydrolase
MRRALAVAQTIPVRGDVQANIEHHLRLIRIAAEDRAQVVVFPELSLTGYELDLGAHLAFSPDDARLEPLIEAAAAFSMTLIVGAPARLESRLHIGALILHPSGAVEVYTKHHLGAFSSSAECDGIVPPAEATWFRPGDRNPPARFGESSGAVAICADTGRPSHPAAAAARGATSYLASMFMIPSEFEREAANLRSTAQRYGMTVAFANYGGPSGGLASAGRSTIWSGRGEVLVQLDRAGAGVAVASEGSNEWRGRRVMLDSG